MKIFISWSGAYSHGVAMALKQWLPYCFQGVKTFVSSEDIRKGKRWLPEVAKELATTSFGIICLTPDNLDSPWVLFEAGALSKLKSAHVCTLLLGNLRNAAIEGPLSHFQSTQFNKTDFFKLLQAINSREGKNAQDEIRLKTVFEKFWDDLERDVLEASKAATGKPDEKRPIEDVVYEILEVTRSIARNFANPDDEIAKLRKLLNLSVDELELSKRAVEFLHTSKIRTLASLSMKTEGEILKFQGGRSVIAELKQKLESLGLALGMNINKSLLEDTSEGV